MGVSCPCPAPEAGPEAACAADTDGVTPMVAVLVLTS